MPTQHAVTRDSHTSRRRQEAERTDPPRPAETARTEDQLEEMQRVNPDDHVSSK